MQKFLAITASSLLALVGLVGCQSADNVASCESWLDAVSCGEYDFSTAVDCSIYEDVECDISDYFDCLTDNTTCDEATGIPDTSGWTSCTDLATCD